MLFPSINLDNCIQHKLDAQQLLRPTILSCDFSKILSAKDTLHCRLHKYLGWRSYGQ